MTDEQFEQAAVLMCKMEGKDVNDKNVKMCLRSIKKSYRAMKAIAQVIDQNNQTGLK